jgi:hypothetical protein
MDGTPSIISHVSLGTTISTGPSAFYDKVLAVLGCRRIMEHPGAVAWGRMFPEFWIQTPYDGGKATVGNGVHVGFIAGSRE